MLTNKNRFANRNVSVNKNVSANRNRLTNKNTHNSYIVTDNLENIYGNKISIYIYIENIFTDNILGYIDYLLNYNYHIIILIDYNSDVIYNVSDYCKNKNIKIVNNYLEIIKIFNYYIAFITTNNNIHSYMINHSYKSIAYKQNNDNINIDIFDVTKNIDELKHTLIKSIIPMNIYVTWKTKNLPKFMEKNLEDLKIKNPEFNIILYDNNDCTEFIKNNFNKNVLDAYMKLKPGAYKADLWRYCILYKNGGIYIDIKLKLINNFKLILLTDNEYYVQDDPDWFYQKCGIYNALLVALPNNEIYLECINKIVENVNNKYYGYNVLYPTGPGLFGEIYINHNLTQNFILTNAKHRLYYKNIQIITEYPEYRNELSKTSTSYVTHWVNRDIYN